MNPPTVTLSWPFISLLAGLYVALLGTLWGLIRSLARRYERSLQDTLKQLSARMDALEMKLVTWRDTIDQDLGRLWDEMRRLEKEIIQLQHSYVLRTEHQQTLQKVFERLEAIGLQLQRLHVLQEGR